MTNGTQQFWHLTAVRLAPGSIIEPGNWGRLIGCYQTPGNNVQTFGNFVLLSRELIFESVRANEFPDRPSRLSSTFALSTEAGANAYRALQDPERKQVLCTVEHVDPGAAQHTGFLQWLDWPAVGSPFVETISNMAQEYWAGHGTGYTEVVSSSALRVVACLD